MSGEGTGRNRIAPWAARLLALAFGTALVLVLVTASELLCGWLNERKPRARFEGSYTKGFFLPDAQRGFRPAPSRETTCTRIVGDRVAFRAVYHTDAFGRRVTPLEGPAGRSRHALFLGCSFTFGEGVADGDTLPAQFGRAAPSYVPYNLGFCGWGPQQALEQLLDPAARSQVPERDGIAVYTYLVGHEDRAIGRMRVVTEWGAWTPMWRIGADGGLVREGPFLKAHPHLWKLYSILSLSETLAFLGVDVPLRIRRPDYELTASILAGAARVYRQRFGSDRFYVLVYPTTAREVRILPLLHAKGLRVLDYSRLFDPAAPGLFIEDDGHPTPAAYGRVAERLARDVAADDAR